MKQVTLYPYDPQLRPGVIGADFEDGNPNNEYTVRYAEQDAESLMEDVCNWIFEETR